MTGTWAVRLNGGDHSALNSPFRLSLVSPLFVKIERWGGKGWGGLEVKRVPSRSEREPILDKNVGRRNPTNGF